MDLDLAELTRAVRALAAEQGGYLLEHWSSIGVLTYKDRRDMVTDVDLAVERRLIEKLRVDYPGHGFQGEETGNHNPEAEYQWLIDPIDGTKYFFGLASFFSVSIALALRGEPILGVVYNAPARQCFHAFRGGGAFLDGLRLNGPKVKLLEEVIANVDTPNTHGLPAEERLWFEKKLVELTRRVYRVRALGLGSLSACWLATGALDAYVDLTGYVKPQDTGAGLVIMREAGLETEYLEVTSGPSRLVAAPRVLFGELRDLLLRD